MRFLAIQMAAKDVIMFLLLFLGVEASIIAGLEQGEVELLHTFKSSIKDPFQHLSNWDYHHNSSHLSFCNWHGISCDHSSSHVTMIDLSGVNISGTIPANSIFKLPFVERIDLANNHLSGEIPGEFSSSTSLRYLNLSTNNFTGSLLIATVGSSASRLETLDLSSNMISGEIPAEVGLIHRLKVLDLGGNAFRGEIPMSVTNLTGLQFLTLSSNQLTGQIHREIGKMKNLRWIYFGYNNLSGVIPSEIGGLTHLNHLDLVYNSLSGEIPQSMGKLWELRYLFLYQNRLSGPIPRSVLGLRRLVSLDLSDNSLSGEIPEGITRLQNLEVLQLFANNFTGNIPNGLVSLPRLQVLQLWSNGLSGMIPEKLGERNNLTVLDLSSNQLSGRIPETLCSSGRLFKLILFSNHLEGRIPKSLSLCRSLRRVRLQNNQLSGGLPPEFKQLPLLNFLDISGNNLSGEIGGRRFDMPELQMMNLARNRFTGALPESFGSEKLENLDLSDNLFSGRIPSSFGSFSELMQLKISYNELSGGIPDNISSCKNLVSLNLAHNHLTGEIPASLGDLPALGELDLSENQLSGEIPGNLGKVESLVFVNISHNHFRGRLPATGAFLAINASSVSGNELCGGDSASGLPPCRGGHKNLTIRWLFLTCLSSILAATAISSFVVFLVLRRRNFDSEIIKRVEEEDGTCWEIQLFDFNAAKAITIDDVVSSTPQGGGGGGPYRVGFSRKSGMKFIVKEVPDVKAIPDSSWKRMAGLGKIRHRNIVNLIGICWSKKIGFLIYEFVEGKSLSEALRGLKSWEQRWRVACGIARALRFLHAHWSPAIAVENVSPDNIIIDGDGEPRLRLDFPTPGIRRTNSKCLPSSAYVAPETGEAKEITNTKGDIYGFGLILIELLTGRTPADMESGVHLSIVEWAHYCYSDCHLDTWIDPTMRTHASNNQNEMVETMSLALQCTASDPSVRPCAAHVLKTLVSIMNSRSCVPSALTFSSPV